MSVTTEECWQKAFKAVREQFEIDNHLPERENVLREFLGGQNIFVNLPTVYGKSLIFRCLRTKLRISADICHLRMTDIESIITIFG